MAKKSSTTKRSKVKALPKGKRELNAKDLQKLKGGATDLFIKYPNIKGESKRA